ncbi:putative quinol monooxygenase [Roseicella aerolata]|uniref:Antibiotic biosynthesis monooxygenase n=1 Tax=Roseicella aerolata TaxID=2883479 RepID=A0A9X1IEJ9_9PROT|nr:putative quinol monooxygenase [Roseicella aerolata]MCB4822288.1 antibiotic biosynthesis monooxygenase [Roseicella aerolata]
MPDVSPEPFTILITLQVRPGREAEFLGLLAPVLNAMRHEPTFINTILHQDPEDPCRFLLYETWTDRRDLVEVQMQRPYRAALNARLPDLLAEPRRIEVWQALRADFAFRSG